MKTITCTVSIAYLLLVAALAQPYRSTPIGPPVTNDPRNTAKKIMAVDTAVKAACPNILGVYIPNPNDKSDVGDNLCT